MKKNLKKNRYMYMYIHILKTESLCYTPETNTTLEINYTSIKKIRLKKKEKKNAGYQ